MNKMNCVERMEVSVRMRIRDHHAKKNQSEIKAMKECLDKPGKDSQRHALKALKHLEKFVEQQIRISALTDIPVSL